MPYELCIKLSNLVSCGIALVRFPDDGTLRIETGRNVQGNNVMGIPKEQVFVYFVGFASRIKRCAPHNDVSVNDGPHIRRWSQKIII
jgi:hypothetical protein